MSLNAALLVKTFGRVQRENGGSRAFGLRFYERLFEKYPAVRPLFKTLPEEQHKKLLASLGVVVASAGQPSRLLPYLRAMAIRHIAYGTENVHYAAVSENLVAVLAEHLSQEGEWTAEMQDTWEKALALVSGIMIEAASDPEEYRDEIVAAGYRPDGFRTETSQPWMLAG